VVRWVYAACMHVLLCMLSCYVGHVVRWVYASVILRLFSGINQRGLTYSGLRCREATAAYK